MSGLRVIVCGGRNYDDYAKVREALGFLHAFRPIRHVYHGGASGADQFAGWWARENGVHVTAIPAEWDKHGRAAGPRRNAEILMIANPDVVVAFPGGRGTADMVTRAIEHGADVWRPAIETYGSTPTDSNGDDPR